MILTDREIEIAIQTEAIKVQPNPALSYYSSTSLDLTLDGRLTIFKPPRRGLSVCIDPSQSGYEHEAIMAETTEVIEIDPQQGYEFGHRQMVLAWTQQSVELKYQSRIAARVEGKARLLASASAFT